ncbi:ABC-type molybdate transport system, substrate-binding protein [Tistlia consotensis]|uniref:ABC-type molybdate transport system, substrate-binding protein n=1 Tax=Tistlia consotensis USBA 355 TaxID=560819 RepID=A0A1Y6BXZ7_9PROT|nr:molybdate ABC transporter substrate-binding protein [Tistlia consotensis]SMF23706.1 ABC-type molybdate transport system, substrate-binding protein [Tistlia consotensis USBA 355]SNR61341.1 ABC-type molybdate transport system, substrate-binding protein [Tistlia consotensis]
MPRTATPAVSLWAAGSLTAAFAEVAAAFTAQHGTPVRTTFGPSGLLRARIEGGEAADLFASADLGHPEALAAAGRGAPPTVFARNALCLLCRPGVAPPRLPGADGLIELLLDPALRLGTSTPGADPSGDYAWRLFEKAEALSPGSFEALEARALKLTGGPDSAPPPADRNAYAWLLSEGLCDLFLTYRTNALLARLDTPALTAVAIPPALAVAADYGMIVLAPGQPAAARLARFLLSPAGRAILDRHGFEAPGQPRDGDG